MGEDLQARLRRLGVAKGVRHLRAAETTAERRTSHEIRDELQTVDGVHRGDYSLETLLPGGRIESTRSSACFVLDTVYPSSQRHGPDLLSDLLQITPEAIAVYSQDRRLRELDFADFLFIDTETTGLAGAGVLAFMVGAAFFEQGPGGPVLVVRQYFLRDHDDEPAMLRFLLELVESKSALVTFNGRSFDLPLLDNRYLMNRIAAPLLEMPHVDLLHPARRLWRNRLGSCALGALERSLLDVRRSEADVPGWLIPSLYREYILTGDAREMRRVFYHNEIDMLSMVTLTSRVSSLLAAPGERHDAIDLYSLGKWQADMGMTAEAESTLRAAAAGDLTLDYYHQTLQRLALLLKREGRREEAVPIWQQIAATSFDNVNAHVELAKHYEWQHGDLETALHWTQDALNVLGNSATGSRSTWLREELVHRLNRLERKTQG